jgi:Arc/MetJ-type ribon-helix-helix transcriptional regulator
MDLQLFDAGGVRAACRSSVASRRFRNRSQAIEAALSDKLERLARTRLARESAKLNPREEKRLAEDGLIDALDSWPEY